MSDNVAVYQSSFTWDAPVIGHKAVTTAGTQVAVSSSAMLVKSVIIQAKNSNTSNVFIGSSSIANNYTGGVALIPGASIEIGNVDLNRLYVNSLVNGEGVQYIAFVTP